MVLPDTAEANATPGGELHSPARGADAGGELVAIDLADEVAEHAPARVDKERLREAGEPVVVETLLVSRTLT